MEEKIYLVTSGSYSDYGVDAVFTTRDLAQSFIDSFKEGSFEMMGIEEWDLNPFERQIRDGFYPYFVRMTKGGECTEIRKSDSAYGFTNSYAEYRFDTRNAIYTHVFARDEAHAIKITNERRAQIIATNKWKGDE
jgi:hypothetical protein